jgi:Rps23 Pro-64 3,4-dihydroxylase Tpa1-like proline 4-hydroxylase
MLQAFSDKELLSYRHNWRKAQPFPHVVINNFTDNAMSLAKEFPDSEWSEWVSLGDSYQKNKYSCSDFDSFPSSIKELIIELSGPKFLQKLEQITSIDGLIPDPYLTGGGLHCSLGGGILAPHTDFHIYQKLGLYRRINLLLYLNEDWQQGDGGELELAIAKAKPADVCRIEPVLNRAVVFQTDDKSIHGFSTPVRSGAIRKSIALYYYTSHETRSFSGDQTTFWRTHGSLGLAKYARISLYKILLKVSRMFSLLALIVNPNQGVSLVRKRLKQRR